jgi:hypothetical protein
MSNERMFCDILLPYNLGDGTGIKFITIASIPRSGSCVIYDRKNAPRTDSDWCIIYTASIGLRLEVNIKQVIQSLETGDDIIIKGYEFMA